MRTEINVADVAQNNNVDTEVDRLSNYQAYKTDTAERYKENHLAVSSAPDQNLIQPTAEKTKMQDAAIQTIPSCDSFDGDQQDQNLSDIKVDESVQTSSNNKSTQRSSLSPQDSIDISGEFRSQSGRGSLLGETESYLSFQISEAIPKGSLTDPSPPPRSAPAARSPCSGAVPLAGTLGLRGGAEHSTGKA